MTIDRWIFIVNYVLSPTNMWTTLITMLICTYVCTVLLYVSLYNIFITDQIGNYNTHLLPEPAEIIISVLASLFSTTLLVFCIA